MAAAQTNVEFDYASSKAAYMARVAKYFDEDSTHSEATIQKTINILKDSATSHLHKVYKFSYSFGREILMEKMKPPAEPVQVLTYEDVFDIFIKHHISNNHEGGREHLLEVENNFRCAFNYPNVCLSLIIKSCNVCKAVSKANHSKMKKSSSKVSLVYVTIMLQRNEFANFRYLLIYIDKATDFVVLRPLNQKSDVEVAMEIFKILMQFGPPKKLCMHGYHMNFNKRVGSILRQVCPMLNFSIEYQNANFDPSSFVVDKLQDWMMSNGSVFWEIGCSVIQKELNDHVSKQTTGKTARNNSITKLSPHELFYGKYHPLRKNVDEMYIKHNTLSKRNDSSQILETRDQEAVAVDNNVVELRIPSPDNYAPDPLDQFEDTPISQEVTIDDNLPVDKVKIKDERDDVAQMITTSNIEGTGVKNNKEAIIERNIKQNLNTLNSNPKHTVISEADSEILLLQMDCEDEKQKEDNKEEKDNIPSESRKMTLRNADVDISGDKSPVYVDDEEMVYEPDIICIDEEKDPFEDVESPI